MITLLNLDNMTQITNIGKFNLIYGDMIYENPNLEWITKYWNLLNENSIMEVHTDYHTSAQVKILMDSLPNSIFINEIIYKQEWGGTSRKGFPRKHDNIYIYANGKDYPWYGEKIQISKKTAGTAFDKKGTGLKTPCSVFDDLGNFSTMSKERVKTDNGHNIQWQKSLKLMRRLMLPFLKEGDRVCDPFLGSGTTAVVAKEIGCDFVGFELDPVVYEIAKNRLEKGD